MSEIEVGEFVRTKKGKIDKLRSKINDGWRSKNNYGEEIARCECGSLLLKDIEKHSHDITDLIEVGDIVYTKDVLNEDIVYIWSQEYLEALKEDINNGIKLVSILTHEQFAQNCYEVEE